MNRNLLRALLCAIVLIASASKSRAACPLQTSPLDSTLPQLKTMSALTAGNAVVKGTFDKSVAGNVAVCVTRAGGAAPSTANVALGGNATFQFPALQLQEGDTVQVQFVSAAGGLYGQLSEVATVTADANAANAFHGSLVAGFEQAGYSSLSQSTDPFVQAFFSQNFGGASRHNQWSGWGRVRLLGTPQASTNGIGSAFTDPSGTVTKQSFNSVGASMDYVAGVQYYLAKSDNAKYGTVGVVAGFGATTPLSSSNATLFFTAPPAGTYECQQVLARFTTASGYPQLNPGTTSCLVGADGSTAVTTIAFANQDRTNFLSKWGAGFRFTGVQPCVQAATATSKCANAYRVVDITIGQDSAVTGGKMSEAVLKIDALYPLPIPGSFFYLYGSSYTRIAPNQDYPPLILATPTTSTSTSTTTTTPTIPSLSVVVLPYRQPDRDFFRLGIGINLTQAFCKLSSAGCSN